MSDFGVIELVYVEDGKLLIHDTTQHALYSIVRQ